MPSYGKTIDLSPEQANLQDLVRVDKIIGCVCTTLLAAYTGKEQRQPDRWVGWAVGVGEWVWRGVGVGGVWVGGGGWAAAARCGAVWGRGCARPPTAQGLW